MAVEITAVNVIIGFVIGALAGAFSAFIGWNKSQEEFEARKFIAGVVTGVLVGLAFVLGLVSQIQNAVDQTALIVVYIGIFLGVVGVDNLRTSVSSSVSKEEKQPEVEEEPTQ